MTIAAISLPQPTPTLGFSLMRRGFGFFACLCAVLAPFTPEPIAFFAGASVPWLCLRLVGTPTTGGGSVSNHLAVASGLQPVAADLDRWRYAVDRPFRPQRCARLLVHVGEPGRAGDVVSCRAGMAPATYSGAADGSPALANPRPAPSVCCNDDLARVRRGTLRGAWLPSRWTRHASRSSRFSCCSPMSCRPAAARRSVAVLLFRS